MLPQNSAQPSEARVSHDGQSGDWATPLLDGALLATSGVPLPDDVLRCASRVAEGTAQAVRLPFHGRELGHLMRKGFYELGADASDGDLLCRALDEPLDDALSALGVDRGLLRLEIVQAQTCPKLHVDRLRLDALKRKCRNPADHRPIPFQRENG